MKPDAQPDTCTAISGGAGDPGSPACVVCGELVDLGDPQVLTDRTRYELRLRQGEPTFRLRDDVHHGRCHVTLGFQEAREAIRRQPSIGLGSED